MRISLIGMSGGGKTHWSKKLEALGFKRFCCDDLLEKKLAKPLKPLGVSGTAGVSAWMGQPYHAQYPKNSQKYLELEKQVMLDIFSKLNALSNDKNVVIDTTGSVIYTGKSVMATLSRLTTIVFLDVPQSVKDEMHKLYLADPKPVIWGDAFQKKSGESDLQALSRCYPSLLSYRTKLYKKYANFTLDYFALRKSNVSSQKVLQMLTR